MTDDAFPSTPGPKPARPALRRKAARPVVMAALIVLVMGGLLWPTWYWARQITLHDVRARTEHELTLVVENLRGELAKFAIQPRLLSTDPNFLAALRPQAGPVALQHANLTLERITDATGALDTYLMNADGRTIASSNWAADRSFIGRNFDYRPYFQAAMEGRLGRFFALGSTSRERGYYFAHPVRDEATHQILGVIVVKMGVTLLERKWRSGADEVMVLDDAGVVFLSSREDWTLKSVAPLAPDLRRAVAESRRYPGVDIPTLDIAPRQGWSAPRFDGLDSGSEEGEIRIDGARYLAMSIDMADAGWRVVALADAASVERPVQLTVVAAALAFATIGLGIGNLYQRRRRLTERLALQEAARSELEDRVRQRTRQISRANLKLREEISERERAEAELRQAQDDLIQASKLAALGQMAAGLSHELNQPLGAIRGYADNAKAYLDRGDAATAKANLSGVAELTERMARIIRNLRAFARKDPLETRPVRLAPVIEDTLALLESKRAARGIEVDYAPPPADLSAIGGEVRLQQVLVNILTNAFDAMAAAPERRLEIRVGERPAPSSAEARAGEIDIILRDTGPGIAAEAIAQVFDPFFSTKEPSSKAAPASDTAREESLDEELDGAGMGLGLSISYAIVERLGGRLRAENDPRGGARFIITLRRAESDAIAMEAAE